MNSCVVEMQSISLYYCVLFISFNFIPFWVSGNHSSLFFFFFFYLWRNKFFAIKMDLCSSHVTCSGTFGECDPVSAPVPPTARTVFLTPPCFLPSLTFPGPSAVPVKSPTFCKPWSPAPFTLLWLRAPAFQRSAFTPPSSRLPFPSSIFSTDCSFPWVLDSFHFSASSSPHWFLKADQQTWKPLL